MNTQNIFMQLASLPVMASPPLKFLLISVLYFAFTIHNISTLTPDGLTILSLLNQLHVPSSVTSSWNSSDSTPCHWENIQCDTNHNVIALNLEGNNITGTLGKDIGKLKFLEVLGLGFNEITGGIPPELANCTNLVNVDLQYNLFTGELPSVLGNLQKLIYFSVYQNRLTGNIPESLFFIPNLYRLMLSYNQFTGVIPSSVGNMSELVSLYFDGNQFSGTIPDSIGNCKKLKEAYFNDNLLVGNLPDSLNNLESLVFLDVSFNGLDGIISFLSRGYGKNLTYLGFSNNRFHGEIPNLDSSPRMQKLFVEDNRLTGKIPSWLGTLSELRELGLGGNPWSGGIPPEIWSCKSLKYLALYGIQLSGAIPREIGLLRDLEYLLFYSSNLTGEVPTEIGKLSKLEYMDISWNRLTGSLAPLAELHSLVTVNISNNRFDGPIPNSLLNSSSLSVSGNRGLCCTYQPGNSSSCSWKSHLSLCEPLSDDRKKCDKRAMATIMAVGLSILCALVLTMLGFYFFRFRNSKNQKVAVFPRAGSPIQQGDLLKATHGSNENPIGAPSKSAREESVV